MGRATARCSPSPPAKKALTRLFRWRWRASRSCSFIIGVVIVRHRFSQKSGAAHDQVANRADDSREILADLKVLETKDDDSSRQQLSITHSVRALVVMRSVQLDRN